jgi:arginine/lysine/ornithine decarboxylase
VLAARADLLGTTSPSSLIYAGLDGWRRHMVEHGHALLSTTIELARSTRSALAEIPGIRVLSRSDLVGPDLADDQDPLKIVLDLAEWRSVPFGSPRPWYAVAVAAVSAGERWVFRKMTISQTEVSKRGR